MSDSVDWNIANLFHPDGAVVYRATTIRVPLSGDRHHIKLQFDEYDNFRAETLNVRVIGGPLKLASFRVPSKNRFDEQVKRVNDDKGERGKVLQVEALNNGLLMVRLKLRNGEEKQIIDVVEIVKTPRRKAMVHLEFENNEKLTGSEAKVPLQINYVLTDVTSRVTYQMNLDNFKLEGFVRIRNQSNKHFAGWTGYSTTPIGQSVRPRRERMMYAMARGTTSSAPPRTAEDFGLDKSTIALGERFVTDRANILFVSEAVEKATICFEADISLPSEVRDLKAQPVLELPSGSLRLVDGSIELYEPNGYKLTSGSLQVGATTSRALLQPLDHSVLVSNKPELAQLSGNMVEVESTLTMHHSGTKTAKLRIKFPEFMRWGSDGYNATFESNLAYLVKLQPGVNTEVVKISYQLRKT